MENNASKSPEEIIEDIKAQVRDDEVDYDTLPEFCIDEINPAIINGQVKVRMSKYGQMLLSVPKRGPLAYFLLWDKTSDEEMRKKMQDWKKKWSHQYEQIPA